MCSSDLLAMLRTLRTVAQALVASREAGRVLLAANSLRFSQRLTVVNSENMNASGEKKMSSRIQTMTSTWKSGTSARYLSLLGLGAPADSLAPHLAQNPILPCWTAVRSVLCPQSHVTYAICTSSFETTIQQAGRSGLRDQPLATVPSCCPGSRTGDSE